MKKNIGMHVQFVSFLKTFVFIGTLSDLFWTLGLSIGYSPVKIIYYNVYGIYTVNCLGRCFNYKSIYYFK